MTPPLSFGSLFSGIGGMDLGLERAGMVCRWQCEVDAFASQVLAKHWPGVARYGDARDIDYATCERVHPTLRFALIAGLGTGPCT